MLYNSYMEKEVWKPIEGYEGYEVSNLGRVKSLSYNKTGKPRLLKGHINKDGYCSIHLSRESNRKYIGRSRLVAEAFIPNPEGKPCVDHINANRTDDRADNLRWCTVKENNGFPLARENKRKALLGHKISEKTRRAIIASNKRRTKPVRCVETGRIFLSATEAAEILSGHASNICNCCLGKQKTYKTYHWEYVNEKD